MKVAMKAATKAAMKAATKAAANAAMQAAMNVAMKAAMKVAMRRRVWGATSSPDYENCLDMMIFFTKARSRFEGREYRPSDFFHQALEAG